MKIAKHAVVSIEYTLKDDQGAVLDSSDGQDPLTYLHGVGALVPGLERALDGHVAGDALSVSLPPADGYGEHDPALIMNVSRSQLGGATDVQPGMQFEGKGPRGPMVLTVAAVDGDVVTLDGNHPLAGQTLNFAVRVTKVRAATKDELQHGHHHGPGGHH